ncbi:MAG: hypothetical protein TREMPRED_005993, partial [Tremellales sp. Tagirdzhanova-0007]
TLTLKLLQTSSPTSTLRFHPAFWIALSTVSSRVHPWSGQISGSNLSPDAAPRELVFHPWSNHDVIAIQRVMQPASKRQLRPTFSLPTTAEKYGAQFGIPEEVQRALQNVGPKGRHNVAQGRGFERTQSFPTASTGGPSSSSHGFHTAPETYAQAQGIIHKELMHARELKPYSEVLDTFMGHDAPSSPEQRAGLSFLTQERRSTKSDEEGWDLTRREDRTGLKRRSSPAEERSGSDTETDEDVPDLSNPSISTTCDDFPPVFRSPEITQPELFVRPVQMPSNGRRTKGMPGRTRGFGKTVSAPVGKVGWGDGGAMDVDQVEMEDGFNVREWAASEEF